MQDQIDIICSDSNPILDDERKETEGARLKIRLNGLESGEDEAMYVEKAEEGLFELQQCWLAMSASPLQQTKSEEEEEEAAEAEAAETPTPTA
mgnify:CR=1 FL=1